MYDRIIAHVTRTPWAILPEKLNAIADLLRFRANGGRLSAEEIQARVGDTQDSPSPSRVERTIAVIPVFGTIMHRANSMEAISGGTSTEMLGKYIRRAAADDSVKSIVLDISSPGGTVEGLPELVADIQAAKKAKPVVAHANALAASAAYWLGSQASEFVVTPSGQVGSIGVYMLAEDMSEYLAKEGIKINAISAGEHKLDGAPWEPMSEDTRAFLQKQVDAVYADFVKAVATGRRVTQATVKAQFGGGRVFQADEALKLGMVDAIETMDQTIARLMQKGMRKTGTAMADGITIPLVATADAATIAAEAFESSTADLVADVAAVGMDAALEPDVTAAVDVTAAQLQADEDYVAHGLRIAELP